MKTVTTRPYAVVLAAAAVVIVAGCTGDPTPPPAGAATPPASSTSTSPTPTTSSATSTTPTASTTSTAATDPNIPPAARAQTSDGAVAFTAYFLNQANVSYNELKPEIVVALALPECKTCNAMVEQVKDYLSRGQRYQGDFVRPTVTTIATFEGNDAKTFVTSDTKGSKVVDSRGNTVKEVPAAKGNLSVFLKFASGEWRISEIKTAA